MYMYLAIYKYRNTILNFNIIQKLKGNCHLVSSQGRAIFDACPRNLVFRGVVFF